MILFSFRVRNGPVQADSKCLTVETRHTNPLVVLLERVYALDFLKFSLKLILYFEGKTAHVVVNAVLKGLPVLIKVGNHQFGQREKKHRDLEPG